MSLRWRSWHSRLPSRFSRVRHNSGTEWPTRKAHHGLLPGTDFIFRGLKAALCHLFEATGHAVNRRRGGLRGLSSENGLGGDDFGFRYGGIGYFLGWFRWGAFGLLRNGPNFLVAPIFL